MTIAGAGLMAASGMLTSCDFLDVDNYFQATFKEDSVFHSKQNAEGYLWNTPQEFPHEGNIWGCLLYTSDAADDLLTV